MQCDSLLLKLTIQILESMFPIVAAGFIKLSLLESKTHESMLVREVGSNYAVFPSLSFR